MLPSQTLLRNQLKAIIADKKNQGHQTDGLNDELIALPDSYDALAEFSRKLSDLPLRPDWPYVEPNDLESIWNECDPARPLNALQTVDPIQIAPRVEAAFFGSVCGCVLGKPLEVQPTMGEIRTALENIHEWPLRDYIPERMVSQGGFRKFHGDAAHTLRENIAYAAPDDDINYTILGMLVLETHGVHFTHDDLKRKWLHNLPIAWTWGPERITLIKAGMASLGHGDEAGSWASLHNPQDEACGAMIRADAYGYACAGNPALAAALAWRDASFTHRRTGIYGTMWASAAIATAFVAESPLQIFRTALQFVPRRSRFYQIMEDCLREVTAASDWIDGYNRIHNKYGQYGHCAIYQEAGTLVNTLRFAQSVGDGIGKQVSQGNDTDSYGATSGSLLGAYFGPGHLEDRWLAPFHDEIRTSLAGFYERSLSKLARRMGQLPANLAARGLTATTLDEKL